MSFHAGGSTVTRRGHLPLPSLEASPLRALHEHSPQAILEMKQGRLPQQHLPHLWNWNDHLQLSMRKEVVGEPEIVIPVQTHFLLPRKPVRVLLAAADEFSLICHLYVGKE